MKHIEATLKMRMDNIRTEVPPFWRRMAIMVNPEANLDNMAKVLKGKSHNEDCIKTFEQIVVKSRAMESVV